MRDNLKWFIVEAFKILGVVFTVHLLNIFMAVAGVICVAFLLAGMALMPIWIVVASVLDVVQHLNIKRGFYTCLAVLYLCFLSLNNWYITLGPWIIIAAGALGVGLFFLSAVAMKFLVKIDVISANFAAFNDSNVRDPDEYKDWLKLSEPTCSSRIAPHTRMTRCLWLAFAYFALFKLFAGVVSVAALCFSVIIPALQLFGAGGALTFRGRAPDTFINHILLIVLSWLLLFVLALVLVISTCQFCNFTQDLTEDSGIPATPSPELITTSFAEKGDEPRKTGVPVGAASIV